MERREWLRGVSRSFCGAGLTWIAGRAWIGVLAWLPLGLFSSPIWAQGAADDPLKIDSTTPAGDLERTIKAGIKARRPSEIAFVEYVVGKVKRGELSPALVRSSFMWARKQPRNQAVYFEQVLRRMAERSGVSLD
ncbi:MAG: hypothetical protein ACKOBW_16195 [Planctomycetota bacterium]